MAEHIEHDGENEDLWNIGFRDLPPNVSVSIRGEKQKPAEPG